MQTRRLLSRFNQELQANNLSLKKDLLRTWVYVREVDNRYQGVVNARRELFEGLGIGKGVCYPASTGIEGRAHGVDCLVDMDAPAFSGLEGEQIIEMEALDHLSPTIRYGVSFERGIRVRFGDRSHLHLYGTARSHGPAEHGSAAWLTGIFEPAQQYPLASDNIPSGLLRMSTTGFQAADARVGADRSRSEAPTRAQRDCPAPAPCVWLLPV